MKRTLLVSGRGMNMNGLRAVFPRLRCLNILMMGVLLLRRILLFRLMMGGLRLLVERGCCLMVVRGNREGGITEVLYEHKSWP